MSSSIPKWKYWLSYLFDIHLESRESEINDTVHVALSKGRIQLYTTDAIYSFEDLYDNFFRAFQRLNLKLLPSGAKVLILGYGMGSIPVMLEKKFNCNYQYTGVEKDEEIIDLANKYILPKLDSPQEIIYGDAQIFLSTATEQYDLIIFDLFINDIIPTKFEKTEILELIPNLLKKDGLVLYNRLVNDSFSKNISDIFLEEIFKPIFKEAGRFIIADNWIIFSDKRFVK